MKTLIWHRSALRHAIAQKLHASGFGAISTDQYEHIKYEDTARRIQTCGIDIFEEHKFGLNTRPIYKIPPNERTEGLPDLITLLSRKAQKLVDMDRPIDCMWSGGIDSTATILILNNLAKRGQLHVILSEGSIDENPKLYEDLVKHLPHQISYDKNIRSLIHDDRITVHANEADTNYGMTGPATPLWETNTLYYKLRYGHQNRVLRDFAGICYDRVEFEPPVFREQELFIPQTESLFTDWDVLRWFIDKTLRNEIVINREPQHDPSGHKGETYNKIGVKSKYDMAKFPDDFLCDSEESAKDILQSPTYFGLKMELRDYIAQEWDTKYAYNKGNTASYSHGQIDMFSSKEVNPLGLESRNVGLCEDGEIIRREQMEDIDPFDFIIP